MSKSETKKILLGVAKKYLGEADYYDKVTFQDTLIENAKRKARAPCSMTLFDALVKLRQYLCANSLPTKAGVTMDKFLKEQDRIMGIVENGETDDMDLSVDTEGPSDSSKPTSNRHLRRERHPGFGESTWHSLINAFVATICHEMERLSPPYFALSPGNTSGRPVGPCMPPVVVVGFDKTSEEEIKADTGAKRAAQLKENIEKKRKDDIEKGYEPKRGLPVTWDKLGDACFDPRQEQLPYPAEAVFASKNMRKTTIRYLCKMIIQYARSGYLANCILRRTAKKRLHRVMQVVLDGHCMYPVDDEVDLLPLSQAGKFGNKDLPDMVYATENTAELPMGIDSELRDTPVSIFLVFDERNEIEKRLDDLYDCPTCDVMEMELCLQAKSRGSDNEYNPFIYNKVSLEGRNFCSKDCPRYQILSRKVNGRMDAMNANRSNGLPVTSHPTYCFVGGKIPDVILDLLQATYSDAPMGTMAYGDNGIGEFDFTQYHYIFQTSYQVATRRLEYNVRNSLMHEETPPEKAMGARILTVDTDALVMGILAIEVLKNRVGLLVDIFMVDTHSGNANKLAKEVDVFNQKAVSNNYTNSPSGIYHINGLVSVMAKIYTDSRYPASNVAFLLYLKINDYTEKTRRLIKGEWKEKVFLDGASLQVFYDVYNERYKTIGTDLIIDYSHRQKWANCDTSNMNNPILTFDFTVLKKFVSQVIYYSAEGCQIEGRKRNKRRIDMPEETHLARNFSRHLYVLSLYCDAATGRADDEDRTIPPRDANKFGFTKRLD